MDKTEDHLITRFRNGIRLVHKQVNNTKIVHCGFILDIGSRDEEIQEQGVAHFWEHMAFKGTKKRNFFHIIDRLESVGGELNAFTTKEKICFYASVLDKYFENAVELLTDITFRSVFPHKEIVKEKQVILDEMLMYYDNPDDSIQDDFDNIIFPGQPMGRNILGTRDSVMSIRQKSFAGFINRNLHSDKIVFSVVGNISADACRKIVEKYIEGLPGFKAINRRKKPVPAPPENKIVNRSISRAYCAIGRLAYSIKHHKRLNFFLLTNILGGPALNSKLNLALREHKGLVYSIDASYSPYSDTGIFGIFFGTERKLLEKCLNLVTREMLKLKTKPLGTLQINKAREQMIGQLAMAEENYNSLMLMLGRSILDLGYVDRFENIVNQIRKITSAELRKIADEMFDDRELSSLIYYPN
ncbi:MAG TPA: pitrilysin family protein [Cyclobacteriaceae bacterium]|nr:pitrilysin family protein [Cyclobacteriaceae bacterium]